MRRYRSPHSSRPSAARRRAGAGLARLLRRAGADRGLRLVGAGLHACPTCGARCSATTSTSRSSPDAVQRVLLDNAANYVKPDIVKTLLKPTIGRGLLTSDGGAVARAAQDRRRQFRARRRSTRWSRSSRARRGGAMARWDAGAPRHGRARRPRRRCGSSPTPCSPAMRG